MKNEDGSRRNFLKYGLAGVGAALVLDACNKAPSETANSSTPEKKTDNGKKVPDAREVTAVEDLMREHGILRRCLLVYSETALLLRKKAGDVSPDALQKTATLFRAFGEDYHEKKLEEAFIFPKIKEKGSGDASKYPDILIAQHTRGREITEYIISVTNAAKLGTNAIAFADTLEAFVRMYEHHAAREDTIVFPAWKDLVTSDEYDELNDKFEDIEHEQFGEDGFEDAVKQIGEIETVLGMNDISKFTASPPAK